MNNSESGFRELPTGAVHSTDADATRYDLITPVGLASVAKLYRSGEANRFIGFDLAGTLGMALRHSYLFLAGNGPRELERAAVCVLEAIAIDRDEPRCPHFDAETGFELIPLSAFEAVAEASAEGATKYPEYNWEKGTDVLTHMNHGIRHLRRRLGDEATGEDDLGHAGWRYLGAIHSLKLWPGLNAGKLRSGGCLAPGADPAIFRRPNSTFRGTPSYNVSRPAPDLPGDQARGKLVLEANDLKADIEARGADLVGDAIRGDLGSPVNRDRGTGGAIPPGGDDWFNAVQAQWRQGYAVVPAEKQWRPMSDD